MNTTAALVSTCKFKLGGSNTARETHGTVPEAQSVSEPGVVGFPN